MPIGEIARSRSGLAATARLSRAAPGPVSRATARGEPSRSRANQRTRRRRAPPPPGRDRRPAVAGGRPTRWSDCRTPPRSRAARPRHRPGRRRRRRGRSPPGCPEQDRAAAPRPPGRRARGRTRPRPARATSRWRRASAATCIPPATFLRGMARVGCRTRRGRRLRPERPAHRCRPSVAAVPGRLGAAGRARGRRRRSCRRWRPDSTVGELPAAQLVDGHVAPPTDRREAGRWCGELGPLPGKVVVVEERRSPGRTVGHLGRRRRG